MQDEISIMSDGSAFQARGAVLEKALSVDRCILRDACI